MTSYEERFESNLTFYGTELQDLLEKRLQEEADNIQQVFDHEK